MDFPWAAWPRIRIIFLSVFFFKRFSSRGRGSVLVICGGVILDRLTGVTGFGETSSKEIQNAWGINNTSLSKNILLFAKFSWVVVGAGLGPGRIRTGRVRNPPLLPYYFGSLLDLVGGVGDNPLAFL